MSNNYPSPSQTRAAMGMMKWGNKDLAKASGLAVDTISLICLEKHEATETTRGKLRTAFELHGIEFTPDDGVRKPSRRIEEFEGKAQFNKWLDSVYDHLKEHGGEVRIFAVDERQFSIYRDDVDLYRKRMIALKAERKDIRVRILAGLSSFASPFAEMRRAKISAISPPTAFYTYGNFLALISFASDDPPYVALHKTGPLAEAYRQSFDAQWDGAEQPDTKVKE